MLNEGQRRHLSATLRVAEERLLTLQQRLQQEAPHHTLAEIDDDLSATERPLVLHTITHVLRLIAEASTTFHLSPTHQSLRRRVVAELSITWADLQGATSTHLRAYGTTDPRLRDVLDPLLERIADSLLDLCTALSGEVRRHGGG